MIKKAVLALFGLIFSIALITPPKADAQVVVVAPRPYVYVGPPVVYGPRYYRPYYYPGRVWIGGRSVARPYAYHYYGPRGWRR